MVKLKVSYRFLTLEITFSHQGRKKTKKTMSILGIYRGIVFFRVSPPPPSLFKQSSSVNIYLLLYQVNQDGSGVQLSLHQLFIQIKKHTDFSQRKEEYNHDTHTSTANAHNLDPTFLLGFRHGTGTGPLAGGLKILNRAGMIAYSTVFIISIGRYINCPLELHVQ